MDSIKADEWSAVPAQYFSVACRFCGEIWDFPKSYMDAFKDDNRKWECPNCRNKIRRATIFGFFND